ncbi:MAG TPA: tRNA uridine-5-carboxymethylaminomethyl(34) synthesis enzyme MnmG [Thermomicrobiales bacterium]|nr:tRNA uridine-5-carboxymethylaminomethyl(34) synthesis enzyme MnmG [Thermomicrobiales bacterium]
MAPAQPHVSHTSYDVVVIGAGHAGCEAALAAARTGASVLVLTPNLDRIGFMPCNPSIGGPAKGHIVAEIDALGGAMAEAIDRTALQIRVLNASKGPAVQALRAQADKTLYSMAMKEALETQPGVELRQESARTIEARVSRGQPAVTAVVTDFGNTYQCKAAVITAGTFLRGNMIAGDWRSAGGRAGEGTTRDLAVSIGDVGIRLRRLKTGTPPRIDARTIDFSLTEAQHGSDVPLWFSRAGRAGRVERLDLPPLAVYPGRTEGWRPQLSCYLVQTNAEGHDLIARNVDRSPMFNGSIQGIGPRYCPSIEDKVMRFREKQSHGLFLEPEGWRTTEVYVQGANTSLPHDVQLAFLRTIPALRDARITRYGYAVEYDAIEPTELTPWFASKRVDGLFLAGQVNGTSGYEEAAGQGLLAGLNAARYAGRLDPVTLGRDEAYIGVMADDLTTQDFVEPYRMLTSRAEHRILLRPDTADDRLARIAHASGLIDDTRRREIDDERRRREGIVAALDAVYLTPNAATSAALAAVDLPPASRSMTAAEYAQRPDSRLPALLDALMVMRPEAFHSVNLDDDTIRRVETDLRYGAYAEKEREQVERASKMEHLGIPPSFDYERIPGLRNEAREKLRLVRPATVGQASRIAGVTPADVGVLLVYLRPGIRAVQDDAAAAAP